ncbi:MULTISPECIES: hypothetical protein [Pseudomonas]|uniref:hypothetical protein n=1 Tax=Pseudomonas TaxID=286 RepID=UPI001E33BCFB|nr:MULTISPECIES: hypothetical protein [Pseudomonas]MCE1118124.1 hypothetical protein [Pseudomonas sp. NMI795_08]
MAKHSYIQSGSARGHYTYDGKEEEFNTQSAGFFNPKTFTFTFKPDGLSAVTVFIRWTTDPSSDLPETYLFRSPNDPALGLKAEALVEGGGLPEETESGQITFNTFAGGAAPRVNADLEDLKFTFNGKTLSLRDVHIQAP